MGHSIRDYYGDTEGDTRSLDYGSHGVCTPKAVFKTCSNPAFCLGGGWGSISKTVLRGAMFQVEALFLHYSLNPKT